MDDSRDFDDCIYESRDISENLIDLQVVDEADRTPLMSPQNNNGQIQEISDKFDRVWQDIEQMFQQHKDEMKSYTQQFMYKVDAEISVLKNRLVNSTSPKSQLGAGDVSHSAKLTYSDYINDKSNEHSRHDFISNQCTGPSRSDFRHTIYTPPSQTTQTLLSTAEARPQQSFNLTSSRNINCGSQSGTTSTTSNLSAKMKPQHYDGKDDLEDYLSQFEILSDLNAWNYETKSLYLASSLKGDARALLSELTSMERRDYGSLVNSLKLRFGSLNRSEIYKANLQTRSKRRDETISELAQSIKKLTRQAYPNAPFDIISTLARDHFIDALPESDMRLRLREAQVKDIADAEILALRLEAYRVADRQKSNRKQVQFANQVETDSTADPQESDKAVKSIVDGFRHEFKGLANDLKQVIKSNNQKPEKDNKQGFRQNQSNQNRKQNYNGRQNNNGFQNPQNYNGRQNNSYYPSRNNGKNSSYYQNRQNGTGFQGNQNRSSTWASARQTIQGPQ